MNDAAAVSDHIDTSISFRCGQDAPILVLDELGMTYKGQRIEDAGEAYRAFLETMRAMREVKA